MSASAPSAARNPAQRLTERIDWMMIVDGALYPLSMPRLARRQRAA
jgi:hypothetical protein